MFGLGKKKPAPVPERATVAAHERYEPEHVAGDVPRPVVYQGDDYGVPIPHRGPDKDYLPSTVASRIESNLGALNRRFDAFVDNIAGLNTALGDFRDKQVVPIKEELRHLRYNLGAKAEQTVTNLDVLVAHLDRQINVVMALQGKNPDEIAKFKEAHGIQPFAPTGQELEVQQQMNEAFKEENFNLTEQVKRLLARIKELEEQLAARVEPAPKKGKRRGR